MWPSIPLVLGLASTLIQTAHGSWQVYQEHVARVAAQPLERRHDESLHRRRVCEVATHDDGRTDDAPAILAAVKECNDGGIVRFARDKTFVVGTAMNLTGLRNVDVDIQGYVQFTNDTDYWQAHSFRQGFQNATSFFQLGGDNIRVHGGGTLDGNGDAWYSLYASKPLTLRPVLFASIGLHHATIEHLHLAQPPFWFNFVANSTNVRFANLDLQVTSDGNPKAPPKNTDGWDTYRSSNILIENCHVVNTDDCVAFKPNSTAIHVRNMHCQGSHGVSVGSLGQYPGEIDVVRDVLVENVVFVNTTDGARIKVWPGAPSELSVDLQGGGGTGQVSNVTYRNLVVDNVDYAIEVTQCYGQKNLTLCNQYPSNLTISDVHISNVRGTASGKYGDISGYIVCSADQGCGESIVLDRIQVSAPDGAKDLFTCGKVDEANLHGINCTTVNKGSN